MGEIKTMRSLTSRIAKIEGKKSETSIANVRESIAVLCDLIHDDPETLGFSDVPADSVLGILIKSGQSRAKRRKK